MKKTCKPKENWAMDTNNSQEEKKKSLSTHEKNARPHS